MPRLPSPDSRSFDSDFDKSASAKAKAGQGASGIFAKSRIIDPPDYNRWLVPPASVAIHLCIGSVYAWSLFNPPLMKIRGVAASAADDWTQNQVVWIFSVAIVFLGLSAAFAGKWLERVGPRLVGAVSACCWGGGFLLGALGIQLHQLWLLYLGYGVIGGCGLGLGYVSPVSTLIKWFPDRRGMAAGLAIMGFGGGAMVGAPLGVALMDRFRTATSVGVAETFVAMGCIYFVVMMFGAVTVRVPPPAPVEENAGIPSDGPRAEGLTAASAIRTGAFWCVWVVLFTNVAAGIGVLGQASPMIQEMFGRTPHAAAGFVGLLSLFNLVGRFAWSSLSDRLGRKKTYAIYLGLGMALYALVPTTKMLGTVGLFVACTCVILSMYGGGFATVPAYLRDLFGTKEVGAIHGRLLTAWSTAALVGPSLVTYVREAQIARGVAKSDAYSITMYGLVVLLAIGFVANLRVRLALRHRGLPSSRIAPRTAAGSAPTTTSIAHLAATWVVVAIPLGWGVFEVAKKSAALFAR